AAGTVEDTAGRRLGSHQGHFRFTVGQRRGLHVAAAERLYVLSIDPLANRVVVGPAEALDTREALVEDLRFPSGAPEGVFRARARVRHRASEAAATVEPDGCGGARVVFDAPVRAVAPGQSCVFYDEDVVIGGGKIRKL